MKAKDVISPIHRTRNHVVLFESPSEWNEEWSIVEAETTEDGEDWNRSLGIRWDGDREDPASKGFPSSSGKAVWFWIPSDLSPFFYGIIIPQLKERKKRERHDRILRKQLRAIMTKLDGVAEPVAA
ncbi:MAG TPA: hypothetical protein VEZ70_03620 [Allosphingosinicella sp.]|nr:hypothetical protein [Allosphingosinicella sp.]